jgi:hypothetical protein
MSRVSVLLVLVAPLVALADVDPKFAALRDAAEPLGGLGPFLEKYIGTCSDPLSGPDCRARAAEFRKKATGQKFYMIVSEDSATMLQPGPYDPNTGRYTILITPFFSSSGLALTHGAPRKSDARGNPLLPFLSVRGTVPEGWNALDFQRLFAARALRLQVVFTPQDVWTLKRKGGADIHGIRARIDGILVSNGRTGDPMGLYLAR